jgi:hypothetical protein
LTERFHQVLPSLAYRVTKNGNGALVWTVQLDGENVVETSEPQTSAWLRLKAFMSRILPERQL